jgi:hypothetical protein
MVETSLVIASGSNGEVVDDADGTVFVARLECPECHHIRMLKERE